jgi:hypothetical protein
MATNTKLNGEFCNTNAQLEHTRLIENQIEYRITLNAIQNSIDSFADRGVGSCQILDLGGGTGRYSEISIRTYLK